MCFKINANCISQIVLITIAVFSTIDVNGQYKRKKNKRDFYGGARDFSQYRNSGLMVELGPSLTFGGKTVEGSSNDSLNRVQKYELNPGGDWGFFANIGMAHAKSRGFNYKKKGSDGKKTEKKKLILISYVDWGLGIKILKGNETSSFVTSLNPGGTSLFGTQEGKRSFTNMYGFGRFTAHRLFKIVEKVSFDFGLGLNVDYRFSQKFSFTGIMTSATTSRSKEIVAGLHTDLGFTFTLKKGTLLNVGATIPVVGLQMARFPEYQSKYLPILFKVKLIQFLKIKSKKGCPPVLKAPGDTKTD